MGWFGKIVGGGLGAAFGGPIGAMIGIAIGHSFDKKQEPLQQQDRVRVSFIVVLFSCLAKLVKADGHISREEIHHLEEFMRDGLHLETDTREFAVKIFNQAKEDGVAARAYLDQFARIINYERAMAGNFLLVFHKLAMADGILHPAEEAFLFQAAQSFRLPPNMIDAMIGKKNNLEAAYDILDSTPEMSIEEIKRKYREKAKAHHPDLLESKGLPPELIAQANEQLAKINEAYDMIKKNRGE